MCEVSLSDLMVGVDADTSGIIAKILVPVGKKCPIDESIAILVADENEYMNYLDEVRILSKDDDILIETTKVIEEGKKKPDMKVLLREIKHMIQEGLIEDGSGTSSSLRHRVYVRYVPSLPIFVEIIVVSYLVLPSHYMLPMLI